MIYKNFVKRLLDFLISLIGLICISPILLVVTIWLHFANRGAGAKLTSSSQGCAKDKSVRARLAAWFAPVFFLQERPGKDAKIFKIIKFKTMTDERDEKGNLLPDAQRLTKVGRIVRSTSIDELPQLINVLKGDMAFIGPRPLLVRYLPYYKEREKLRHTIRPGISGWAQVHGRNNLDWDSRLELDAWYAEHLSFVIDCKVILMTIKNVIARKDIVVVPGQTARPLDLERNEIKKT